MHWPINSKLKKTQSSLLLFIAFIVLYCFSQPIIKAYGGSFGLEDLPRPFVSSGGFLNCSVVVASSVGHGPVGAAHTMDVMGAIMVAAQLGLKAEGAMLDATMDDYISTYDFGNAKVFLKDFTSNLVVVGGPGVNQVTWYYNNLRNASGARVLPVYFDKDQNGVDYIRVASTGNVYRIEYDAQGRVKADYGIILLFQDGGRFVLVLAGLGGYGTWASCKVVSSFESWSLHGSAAVVKYYDVNGDGLLDIISIVEEVSESSCTSGIFSPIAFILAPIPLLASKWKVLKQKIAGRRRLWVAYFLLLLTLVAQFAFVAFSGDPNSEVYTFKDFSRPFVSSGGFLNCSVVVASSVGHGPVGAAHTMDVMGAIMVAAQLGLDATGSSLSSTLDDHISTYDSANMQVNFSPIDSNLVVVGGPGVNQVTWYYNNLRNASGARVLPVYFDKDQNGVDYIRVASTGNVYRIEYDAQGRVKADYGIIVLYYDAEHGMWVLIVAGLGGYGTLAASNLLASYKSWSLFGRAAVVRFADSNGDGYLDEASIVESVGFGKSIDVYWDAKCMSIVESIDWGVLSPGEAKEVTVYIRNEGESDAILTLNIRDWIPAEASSYMKIQWNYTDATVRPGQVVAVAITLTVDLEVNGITDFSVNIEVNSS